VVEAHGAVVAGTDDQVLVAEAPYQEAPEPVLELVASRRLGAGEVASGGVDLVDEVEGLPGAHVEASVGDGFGVERLVAVLEAAGDLLSD
jgi:hypothetical protein